MAVLTTRPLGMWRQAFFLLAVLLCAAGTLAADAVTPAPSGIPSGDVPVGFENATVTIVPNANVPLDATFTDEDGKTVALRDYFKSGRPVILAPVYYNCPMLCNLTLNGLSNALSEIALTPGKDYQIVAISINHEENAELARAKKWNYIKEFGRGPDVAPGWTFLTSPDPKQVRRVCDAIGFGYKRDPAGKEYLHQAAVYVVMPSGQVSRTVPGILSAADATMMRDSITFASEGKIGSPLFRVALSCGLVSYDAATGMYKHNPWVWAGTVGGVLILLTFGGFMTMMWRGEAKRRRSAIDQQGFPPATAS